MRSSIFILSIILISACGNPGSRSGGAVQYDTYASLIISDGPNYDFGSQLVGSNTEHQFKVTNQGKVAASQITSTFYLSQTFSFRGGTYPGTGGTCTTDLPIGASCTVIVNYSPKSNQTSQAGLTLNYFDGLNHTETSGNSLKGTGIYSVSE
jgi:hypothetical protein